jgi:soluble lytic murein transglycosylase-like protein
MIKRRKLKTIQYTKAVIILAIGFAFGRYTAPNEANATKPVEPIVADTLLAKEKISRKDPPCIQMYHYIEKYSRQYKIPRKYAYGIAFKETTYLGPDHVSYNPYQKSSAGALGPMQIMPTTAELVNGKRPTSSKLKKDIEFNVKTSMKILRKLKDKHKSWKVVFGAYNTGRPIVNKYAEDVYCFVPNW